MNGPNVQGTQVLIDGVEVPPWVSVVIELRVKELAKVTITHLAEVSFTGAVNPHKAHICPECRHEIENKGGAGRAHVVDATINTDRWVRRFTVVPETDREVIANAERDFADAG